MIVFFWYCLVSDMMILKRDWNRKQYVCVRVCFSFIRNFKQSEAETINADHVPCLRVNARFSFFCRASSYCFYSSLACFLTRGLCCYTHARRSKGKKEEKYNRVEHFSNRKLFASAWQGRVCKGTQCRFQRDFLCECFASITVHSTSVPNSLLPDSVR